MNNKGFTLIELLAVLAILAVIASVATININQQLKKSDEQTQNILDGKIENAAKLYAGKYHANDIVNGTSFEIKLQELVDDGLLYLNDSDNCTLTNEVSVGTDGTFDYNLVECYN